MRKPAEKEKQEGGGGGDGEGRRGGGLGDEVGSIAIDASGISASPLVSALSTSSRVNTRNWYRKGTDLWAEFGKKTPSSRKFSSKHLVKMPAVGSTPSFGRRAVLRLEEEAFGNT
jgi:hypothetical protein